MSETQIGSPLTLLALQGLKSANKDVSQASERIATGLRIVRASDDPAGLGRAAKLKAEVSSFMQVKKNINGAVGDMQRVTDGLNGILDYLSEMRTLALAASNESDSGTLTALQTQFDELVSGIDEIVGSVEFADENVLGADAGTVTIQVGIDSGSTKTLTFVAASATTLAVSSLDLSASPGAAITAVEAAIDTVSNNLATYGGYEASLYRYSDLADSAILSKSGQYGDIMDADLALEASNLAAAKIRQDSATAVLAQANSMNRNIADYLLNGAIG